MMEHPVRWDGDPGDVVGKLQLLEHLTETLVGLEAELVLDQAELSTFRVQYSSRFAPLFAVVDEMEAQVAARLASLRRTAETAAKASDAARRAADSAGAAREAACQGPAPGIPDPEIRQLFRRAAKLFHPDLATSEEDARRRSRLFVLAKEACDRGDGTTLRELIDQADRLLGVPPVNVASPGEPSIDRRIAAVEARIEELHRVRVALAEDPVWSLLVRVRRARVEGVDLLGRLEADLIARQGLLRQELQTLAGVR